MMKWFSAYRFPFLLLFALLLINSFSADISDPYKKPINGDAKGYYAYLPAVFIYGDLTFSFIPEIEHKYYVPENFKSFVIKTKDEKKVNKTFPGVALLYAPFFFTAHLISLSFGLPADGYAFTYQLFYLIGFWFYFLLGMIFFQKVLALLNFSEKIITLSLIICVTTTNIVFYTLYDSSVTHIYNFFMVNFAIYLLIKLKTELNTKKITLFFIVLAIIGITRPTNFLIIGLILFFVPEISFYKTCLNYLFQKRRFLMPLIFSSLILFIPFILWKLQTGSWIVYSYGEEGFNFANPQLFNFLFSYTKGWFLYTPSIFIILVLGIIILLKKERKKGCIAILFFSAAIYIFSSWWCWYYGAGMSQRVMIDYTILSGYLLAFLLTQFWPSLFWRTLLLSVFFLLGILNFAQAYQISKGIYPFGSPTKEEYWDNFLVFTKKAKIYPKPHWKLLEEKTVSLNPNDGQIEKGLSYQKDEFWQIEVSEMDEYSAVIQTQSQPLKKGSKLIIGFDAFAETDIELTRLVVVFSNNETAVYFLKEFIQKEKWITIEFLYEPLSDIEGNFNLFLWNAGTGEKVRLKNIYFNHYFSENYL